MSVKMVCRKCGGKCRVEEGQRLNEKTGNYEKAYRVACMLCSANGPACGTERGAIDAWFAEQNQGVELANRFGGGQ